VPLSEGEVVSKPAKGGERSEVVSVIAEDDFDQFFRREERRVSHGLGSTR